MTAIDMNTGEHAWMIPTGDGDRIRNHPMLRDLDLPPVGGDASRSGPLLTKTLLIHALTAGGGDGGPRLVAYDKATGAEIASLDLPSGALGAPMTYLLDGAQHIALTVGGEVPGAHLVPAAGVILAMTANVGEISVDFELENAVDRGIFERGLGDESSVRRHPRAGHRRHRGDDARGSPEHRRTPRVAGPGNRGCHLRGQSQGGTPGCGSRDGAHRRPFRRAPTAWSARLRARS